MGKQPQIHSFFGGASSAKAASGKPSTGQSLDSEGESPRSGKGTVKRPRSSKNSDEVWFQGEHQISPVSRVSGPSQMPHVQCALNTSVSMLKEKNHPARSCGTLVHPYSALSEDEGFKFLKWLAGRSRLATCEETPTWSRALFASVHS
jgi:hypothetical protein